MDQQPRGRPHPSRGASADSRIVPLLACMVGGVILARVAGGKKAAAILASCRAFLYRAITDEA